MSCGTPLERRCPSCGATPPPEAHFCMECGTPVTGSAPAPAGSASAPGRPVPPAPRPLPEERRHVTVLFADLAGYTAIADKMDPEELKALIDGALRRLGAEVERHGGTVDKYIGDNVMALFGAPVAHEDDPERAVRAGLAMQAAMADINAQISATSPAAVELALRVGINTGEVVAGAVGDAYTVIGDTVNVASRLESAGRPGAVTVGERTHGATRGVIAYSELAPLELKGKSEAVRAWEANGVLAATPAGRSSPGQPDRGPIVGREDELEMLQRVYGRMVRESRPHLVTVIGQAGVGKSRLLLELRGRLEHNETPPVVREGRCVPYGSTIVYWALAEIIRAECGIVDSDPSEIAWLKLFSGVDSLLRQHTGTATEDSTERRAALIGRLLGYEPPPGTPSLESEDPAALRELFFSAVRSMVEAMARRRPVILVFEDIHWADAGMLDLIEYLAQWVHGPLMMICLARDELLEERQSFGGGRRNAQKIILDPLTAEDTRALVTALLPPETIADDVIPMVMTRAGGNPFFVEEMIRRVVEEGSAENLEMPDTVQALLAARLDGLEPFERSLVQQAAVFGRTFWEGSLAALARAEGQDLRTALRALEEKDIIVSEGSVAGGVEGEREFAFRHVLIRDVAYGMLPRATRCLKHYEVGRFIEERAGDRSEELVALLAEHYGRAAVLGEESHREAAILDPIHAKALEFLEAAGDAAASLYSNEEAFGHYQAARDLRMAPEPSVHARICEKQGDVAARMARVDAAVEAWQLALDHHSQTGDARRVGDLHRKIGSALWDRGERRPAIERFQQGINLLKDAEPCLELVRLYEEAATLYMNTGDNMLAIYAAERALRLAEQLSETRAASRAHGIFGRVFGRIGDAAKARENLERSVDLARGADPSETIRALMTLGYHLEISDADYATAARVHSEALQLAEEVGDLPAQVELQSALAVLAVHRADWSETQARAEASVDLAEREGLVGKLCFPYGVRAMLCWREGDWPGAEKWFRRAAELAEDIGWSEVSFSAQFGLALTLRDAGDAAGAIEALDKALEVCEHAGLIAQSIQATSQRAVILALDGQIAAAMDAAASAKSLGERLPYPAGQAAALEAQGVVAGDIDEGVALLTQAGSAWSALGRPLDATRCRMLTGWLLRESDAAAAHAALDGAAEDFRRYGAPHALAQTRSPA
jgi:class 3 adenylate cyclase/tetratricopeptide (TPR) repeat protein